MLQKKICMLGSYGVGKTSLVSQFVYSKFSEKYHTTIGVKVDRKALNIDGQELALLLWDLHGDDEFQRIRPGYLRGMTGYILVIDSTRRSTVEVAIKLQKLAFDAVGDIPFITLINKCDLTDAWELNKDDLAELETSDWLIHQTSAKTGHLVNESFELLAKKMLEKDQA